MKKCTTCDELKELSCFNKDKQKKDGLNPRCKICSRAWHHKNKEKARLYQKEYYENNKQYHAEKAKKYREENKDYLNKKKRIWYSENKEKVEAYRKQNALSYRVYSSNRRAKIKGNGGSHSKEDISRIIELQKGCCAICKCSLDDYHVDHIIPISKGGSNDSHNIQITCQACNLSKSDSDPIEYAQSIGFLL